MTGAEAELQALHLIEAVAPKQLPVKFLLACLQSGNAPVQSEALLIVRQRVLADPACRAAVRTIARDDTLGDVQLEAVFTLGVTDSSLSKDDWLAWCEHPSKGVVVVALRALRQSARPPELVQAVMDATSVRVTNDPDIAQELDLTLRILGVSADAWKRCS